MSFIFGGDDAPQPAAVPQSPLVSEEAQRQRQAAEDAALAQQKAAGRRATMAAGKNLLDDEDTANPLKPKQKDTSRVLVG